MSFIYGEPQDSEKEKSWDKILDEINENEKNMIIGDLNIIWNKEKDKWRNRETKGGTKNKSIRKNILEKRVIDTYREINGEEEAYSFYRSNEKGEIDYKSRIDHCLANLELIEEIKMVEYEQPTEMSPDHCGIIVKINMEVNNINEIKVEEIKDIIIEDIDIANINEAKEKSLREKVKLYAEIKLVKDFNEIDINKVGIVMDKLYNDAKEIIGIKRRIQNKQKGIERNEEVQKMKNQMGILYRAMRSYVPNKKLTKKIIKTLENEEEYRPKKKITKETTEFKTEQEIIELKREMMGIINKIKKDMQILTRKLTQERIGKYITQINNSETNKPGEFFRKCNYDKATSIKSQLTKIEKKIGEDVKIITKNEEVKEEIKTFWKDIFKTRKKEPEKEIPKWLKNKKTTEIKEKITQVCNKIGENITKDEIKTTIEDLKKEKASGKDKIPGEILKIITEEEDIMEYIKTLYNKIKDENIKPDEWRRNVIFTIYKSGSPYEPKNYRPISLMNIIYKVYISIINKRLTETLEKTKTLSNAQAGFRENRNTWQKIWLLKNTIEHQNKKKKQIHLVYIDLAKAYDSVEHWGIKQIMTEYGFDEKSINMIMNMCTNNTAEVITVYGNTEEFDIERGVPQGSPISPILFDLFLNPLLIEIEDNKLGVNIGNKNIGILAFADDMAIISDENEKEQKMMDIISEYCNYYGLSINYDGRDKSVYTNNTENIQHKITFKDSEGKINELIKLKSDESYKYLGIYMNLNMNWERQQTITRTKFLRQLFFVEKKCFNATQTISIINKVIIPAIMYRMQVMIFDKKYLKELDDFIARCIQRKMRVSTRSSKKELYLKEDDMGWGLKSLQDIQTHTIITSLLDYGLNSEDEETKEVTRIIQEEKTETIQKIEQVLKKEYKMQLKRIKEEDYLGIGNYTEREPIIEKLEEEGITMINTIIDQTKDETKTRSKMKSEFNIKRNYTLEEHEKLTKDLSPTILRTVHPLTLYLVKKKPEKYTNINLAKVQTDPNNKNDYWVYTDGSCNNNKEDLRSGYGISISKIDNKDNIQMRTRGEQTVNNAEIQAVEHVLLIWPIDKNITIWSDSEFVLHTCNTYKNKKEKEKRKLKYKDIFDRIDKIVKMRIETGAKTEFRRVYSHTKDIKEINTTIKIKNKRYETLVKHYEQMIKMYGAEVTNIIVDGNERADTLANYALGRETYKLPSVTPEHGEYVILPIKKKRKSKIKERVILDQVKEGLKENIYEQRKKKWLNYIKKEHESKFKEMTAEEIDWEASTQIYKIKSSKYEKKKNMIYKLQHDKFFTKPKAMAKIIEEMSKERIGWYNNKYGNMKNLECVYCKRKIETVEHMVEECEWKEEIREELDENIINAIKEAIFISQENNEENYRMAERILIHERKDENNIIKIKEKEEKEKRNRKNEKRKKERKERRKGKETQENKTKKQEEKKNKKKEIKEGPKNKHEIKIPEEVYKKEYDIPEWWKEWNKKYEHTLGMKGYITKEAKKIWKKLGIKDTVMKILNITIQIMIAEKTHEIWVERCQILFNKEMKDIKIKDNNNESPSPPSYSPITPISQRDE